MARRYLLFVVLMVVATARLSLAVYSGTRSDGDGDFEVSLPDGFQDPAQRPARSLTEAVNDPWTRPTYTRGPTQFLTVLPLAFVGPYATFAMPLLALYVVLVIGTALITWRIARDATGHAVPVAMILTSTFCFSPLLDALIDREFEVVSTVAFALAAWAMIHNRHGTVGAILGYITWYKYLPLLALPYLALRRWWRALSAFAVVSVVIFGAAHAAFGLDRFINNNIPSIAVSRLAAVDSTSTFCAVPARTSGELEPMDDEDDEDSVRVDLCRWRHVVPAPGVLYLLLTVAVAGTAGWGGYRLTRGAATLSAPDERWRRLLELSMIIVIYSTWIYSHYYYLALLIIPFNLLLVRVVRAGSVASLAWWGLSYFLVARFLVPPFLTERYLGIQLWDVYQRTPARLIGELMLLGLILQQYVTLPVQQAVAVDTATSRQE